MLVVIRGAGDLASGIAVRLHHAGFSIVMLDIAHPITVRRTVAFSEAIRLESMTVEGCPCATGGNARRGAGMRGAGLYRCVGGPYCSVHFPGCSLTCLWMPLLPSANLGTRITDAPLVIGVGPGFTAGVDCHAVVETKRGHDLGRVLWKGSAAPNTGVPGDIAGHGADRVLRAPAAGVV